jgi:hypothetical protein
MGCITGSQVSQMSMFFRSLRQHFDGNIVIFVGRTNADMHSMLKAYRVDVIPVDELFCSPHSKFVSSIVGVTGRRGLRRFRRGILQLYIKSFPVCQRQLVWQDVEYEAAGLQSIRYQLYRRYLESHREVSGVLISDVRDVLFQRSVDDLSFDCLSVALEPESSVIGSGSMDTGWMYDLYGNYGVAKFMGRRISCSGVTYGDRVSMYNYLSNMEELISKYSMVLGPRDQTVHNVVLWSSNVAFKANSNRDGLVFTMQDENISRMSASDGFLRNDVGDSYVVVHQYDRHLDYLKSQNWSCLANP